MKNIIICTNEKIRYEAFDKTTIVINIIDTGAYFRATGTCSELIIFLLEVKRISFSEFLSFVYHKYGQIDDIRKKINDLTKELLRLDIIFFESNE